MKRIILSSVWVAFILLNTGCQVRSGSKSGMRYNPDPSFKKHVLSDAFISEGVAVGDVNKDGHIDVMAGNLWFEAPSWEAHEISEPETFRPEKEYSKSFLNFSMDVNQDGWVDLIRVDFPGTAVYWHENPKNKEGHWKIHTIYPTVGNESPHFVDIDGDGRKDLLGADTETREMIWLRAPSKGDTVWQRYAISDKDAPGTERFSHGLGYADLNQDGRKDVTIKDGWWEAPADPRKRWTFHEAPLGKECSQMHGFDVDADGDEDVISTSAHRFGIWWHEQGASGEGTWKTHEVEKELSQLHATEFTDLDGNGQPELITGMRYFAHMGNDPGEQNNPRLVWYELTPGPEPEWTLHEIDNDSGVGINIVVEDITGDRMKDVIIANKKGVFVFEQQR